MTSIYHIGPAPSCVGGMASVIRALVGLDWPGARVSALASWDNRITGGRWRLAGPVALRLWRLRRRASEVIIHIHLSQKKAFIREGGLGLWARLLRLRVYATIHGSSFVATSSLRRWRWWYRWVLRRVDGVAVLDESARTAVGELAPHTPVRIVHNPGPIPEPLRTDLTPPGESPPVVVFAGSVGHRKGVDVLIAAWPAVRQRHPRARLEIFGPVEAGFPVDGVDGVLHGPVPAEVLWQHLAQSRVAVLPSRAEAMPMFIIEAQGLGRPCVVTEVGAMPAQVEGCGVVVPPDDPAALAAGLVRYLDDPALADIDGRCATERYDERYRAAAVIGEMTAFYG